MIYTELTLVKTKKKWFKITTEPVMFMFLFAGCMKFPVIKTLLFKKACFHQYGLVYILNFYHLFFKHILGFVFV